MDAKNSSNVRVRGTVIRVPDSRPGLLAANGQQKPFILEGIWTSSIVPAPNMAVDVTLDGSGAVLAVGAVDAQQLAKEHLSQLGGVAQEKGKLAAEIARQGLASLAARMGKVALGAAAVMWIAWFFLPALKISMFFNSKSFTAWELLGVDLGDVTTMVAIKHGLFSLLGLLAISAPFAAPFIKHPLAKCLYSTPLAYLAVAVLKVRWDIGRIAGMAGRAGGMFADSAESFRKAIMDTLSIGVGTYVLLIAAVILAVCAVRNRTNA